MVTPLIRRFLAVLTVGGLAAGLLLAAAPAQAGRPADSATGGGWAVAERGASVFEKHFSFSAQEHPVTGVVSGHAVLGQDQLDGDADFWLKGHVYCLSVQGNKATLGVLIDKAEGIAASRVGQAILIYVVDGDDGQDLMDNSFFRPAGNDCWEGNPGDPVVSGNVRVVDAG